MALFDAFIDGATGTGLFTKLRWPGAPTEFIDSRTADEFDAHDTALSVYIEQLVCKVNFDFRSRPVSHLFYPLAKTVAMGMLTQLFTKGLITSVALKPITSAKVQAQNK